LIQCDDAKVVELAARIAPDEKDPWKLACALEKHVDRTIQLKNFSQAFATAAEVARRWKGTARSTPCYSPRSAGRE
jgi:pterin-4a-carbinolamine dehydratase